MRIRQAALDAIAAHASEVAPLECCGLLVGSGEAIDRAVRARNLRASPTRYLIDPGDHFAAIRAARADGLDVVGAYHSHPSTSAAPSATDLAESVGPSFLYVIAAPTPGGGWRVAAYRLDERNFTEVRLVPVP